MKFSGMHRAWTIGLLGVVLLAGAWPAGAIDVKVIARTKGLEANTLTGMGLVVGLDGTGDKTKKSKRLARPLYELYRLHGLGVESLDEFDGVDSVAIVFVTARVSETGAREGDMLDVTVSTAGDASSLEGGQLIWTALRPGPAPGAYAVSQGRVEVDSQNPRSGIVRGGAQMMKDIRASAINPADGSVTLVLRDHYAGYSMAKALAERINQEFDFGLGANGSNREAGAWAEVVDPRNVRIEIADWLRTDSNTVIARILNLDLDLSLLDLPARVVIDRSNGVFVVQGHVEISPAVISSRNLTITRITPEPIPTPADPVYDIENHVAVGDDGVIRPRQAARLQDLLNALESLKVPFEERVSILHTMHDTGVLHAELIEVF
ncbi:MAG: flagellar basal body P-ring protein FlgI [Phycisphaerales bacterium]